MVTVNFHTNKKISPVFLENIYRATELMVIMKGSLKSLPKNIHWHLKKGRENGVLEITLITATREVILSCKINRTAVWIPGAMRELKEKLSV